MTTTTERQARRRARLDAIAQAAGYPTWGKLETAALAGEQITISMEGYDDPNSRFWIRRCQFAMIKLSEISGDEAGKTYEIWSGDWNWKRIFELYETAIIRLTM